MVEIISSLATDIIEGVHTSNDNSMSLHTNAGCTIAGSGATGTFQTSNCDWQANGNSGCGFRANTVNNPNNFGADLNSIGGGMYITEWTSQFIQIWFFPRSRIPPSVVNGAPNVTEFGKPTALFRGCDIDSHFKNHSMVINTDFCGAWAGNVYSQFSDCPQNPNLNSLDACVDFVGNNPQAFQNAYWQFNSIQVYQLSQLQTTSSAVPTSTLSSSRAQSTVSNTIPQGMGQTTNGITVSSSYTGPLSSPPVATTTAAPANVYCPDGDFQYVYITPKRIQYQIHCGRDYQTDTIQSQDVSSFEACMSFCETVLGCGGVAYVGGNGPGTCYARKEGSFAGFNELVTDGHTNSGVRMEGGVKSVSASGSASPTSPAGSLGNSTSPPYPTSTAFPTSPSDNPSPSPSFLPGSQGSCPLANNTIMMSENEIDYTVYCGADTEAMPIARTDVQGNFMACFNLCDITTGCYSFTFVGNDFGTCYLKDLAGDIRYGLGNNFVVGIKAAATASTYVVPSTYIPSTTSLIASTQPSYISTTSSESMSGMFSTTSGRASASSSTPSPTATSLSVSVSSTVSSRSIQESAASSSTTPSSSLSSSSTSSSISASPSASLHPLCGKNYWDPYGAEYEVRCGTDNGAPAFQTAFIPSGDFTSCFGLCSGTRGCLGFTFFASENGRSGNCYLKAQYGDYFGDNPRLTSAFIVRAGESSSSSSLSSTELASSSSPVSDSAIPSTPSASPIPNTNTCPATSDQLCPDQGQTTRCSSTAGSSYEFSCGLAYEGTVIDTSDVILLKRAQQAKRAIVPTYQDCVNLCDRYSTCVALNYESNSNNCTLFSSVTGTTPRDGSIGGAFVGAASTASSRGYIAPATLSGYPSGAASTFSASSTADPRSGTGSSSYGPVVPTKQTALTQTTQSEVVVTTIVPSSRPTVTSSKSIVSFHCLNANSRSTRFGRNRHGRNHNNHDNFNSGADKFWCRIFHDDFWRSVHTVRVWLPLLHLLSDPHSH